MLNTKAILDSMNPVEGTQTVNNGVPNNPPDVTLSNRAINIVADVAEWCCEERLFSLPNIMFYGMVVPLYLVGCWTATGMIVSKCHK